MTMALEPVQRVAPLYEPTPRVAQYKVTIIWGTGTDIGDTAYDDVTRFYLNDPGIVIDGVGRDQIRAYSPPAASALDITLNNWGGEFSPGGPIGRLVGRGPKVYVDLYFGSEVLVDDPTITVSSDRSTVNGVKSVRLFSGEINTAQHVLTRPQRSVAIRALGTMTTLLDKRPRTTQLYESTPTVPFRTSDAVAILLDLVGWDPALRVLDVGDTILAYWWLDGSQDGLTALNQLLAAEGAGAAAYEQGGWFHFEGRQFRQNNPRSLNDQMVIGGALSGIAPPGVPLLYDTIPSEYASNPDEVISSATMNINVRAPFPDQVGGDPPEVARVWEWGRPLVVPAGTDGIVTEGQVDDPYKSALTPVAGTDYVVASGALGSVTLLASSGTLVRIRWVSTAGCTVNGAVSNGPQLRAVSLPVISEVVVRSTVDTSAQAPRYQPREHQMDAWPEIDRNQALDIVNSMALRYRDERRQAILRLVNVDGAHMEAMMNVRISDRIRWYQRHGRIDEAYWVERISHEIAPGGGLHTVILGCERVFTSTGGRFDRGVWGTGVKPPARFGE